MRAGKEKLAEQNSAADTLVEARLFTAFLFFVYRHVKVTILDVLLHFILLSILLRTGSGEKSGCPYILSWIMSGFQSIASSHFLSPCSNIRCFKIDQTSSSDASGAPAVWSHGYTEASGVKNKYDLARFLLYEHPSSRAPLCWYKEVLSVKVLGTFGASQRQRPCHDSIFVYQSAAWLSTLVFVREVAKIQV